jgi:hypothetical protein
MNVEASCEPTYSTISTTSARPVALAVMSGRNRNLAEPGATVLHTVCSTNLAGSFANVATGWLAL